LVAIGRVPGIAAPPLMGPMTGMALVSRADGPALWDAFEARIASLAQKH
jgi:hypothetical protein